MKAFLVIYLGYFASIISAAGPTQKLAYDSVSLALSQLAGDKLQEQADKLKNTFDEQPVDDVSFKDAATMKVDAVRLIEPYETYSIVADFLNNRAETLVKDLLSTDVISKRKDDVINNEYKEVISIYNVLNRNDSAMILSIMGSDTCPLDESHKGQKGLLFTKNKTPCESLSKESLTKILDRYDKIKNIQNKYNAESTPVSVEFEGNYRGMIARFDDLVPRITQNKDLQERWRKLKLSVIYIA